MKSRHYASVGGATQAYVDVDYVVCFYASVGGATQAYGSLFVSVCVCPELNLGNH